MDSSARDKAAHRARRAKETASQAGPPTIRDVNDIKRVLSQLDPNSRLNTKLPTVPLRATMRGSTEHGSAQFAVSCNTETRSQRDMLLEGFQMLERRLNALDKAQKSSEPIVVNDREMLAADVINPESHLSIDGLIEHWLGAERRGKYICWDLDEWTYRYEIFGHRLTRVYRDAADGSIGGL